MNNNINDENMMMSLIDSIEVSEIVGTLNKIAQVQAAVQSKLKPGHDYDTIPGTSKPTLLKPGAEKLLMMFGLTSEYEIIEKIEDYDKGVFAYTMKCILSKDGYKITEGVGFCNPKENKYRWRWIKEEDLPPGVDKDSLKKKTNRWDKTEYQVENDEIYSQANTILKMAKKRAQIDAMLTVASLSEVFTQDIEDMAQFEKSERMETMTVSDAEGMKINFGKYKGKTIKEIYKTDEGYIKWLADKAKDGVVKKAAKMVLDSGGQVQGQTTIDETMNIDDAIDNSELPWSEDENVPF